jgi:hypothetical protein
VARARPGAASPRPARRRRSAPIPLRRVVPPLPPAAPARSYCEAFIERDNLYIVMEFAEHGDIYSQIKKFKTANKYVKEDTIWSYLLQICLGLKELHDRSILHRVRGRPRRRVRRFRPPVPPTTSLPPASPRRRT